METVNRFVRGRSRIPDPATLDASRGHREVKIDGVLQFNTKLWKGKVCAFIRETMAGAFEAADPGVCWAGGHLAGTPPPWNQAPEYQKFN